MNLIFKEKYEQAKFSPYHLYPMSATAFSGSCAIAYVRKGFYKPPLSIVKC